MKPEGFSYTRPYARLLSHLDGIRSPIIVEVGTAYQIRSLEEQMSCGMSTLAWAEYVQARGGDVFTIDINPAHIEQCRHTLEAWLGSVANVNFCVGNGEECIVNLNRLMPIDLLFIDGGVGGDVAVRQLDAAMDRLRAGRGIVAFDDCSADDAANRNPEVRVSTVWQDPRKYGLKFLWSEGVVVAFEVEK